MKINYGLTGKERKSLVEAVSQELNVTAKYLGTPRYDYQIGEYNVSRDGVLTGADNRGLTASLNGLGFAAISEEYDQAEPAEPEETPIDESASGYEPEKTSVDENASGYEPEEASMDENASGYDPDGCDGEAASDGAEATTVTFAKDGGFDTINIEYPLKGFTPEKLENLFKMIVAKAPLIKAALGTDELPIRQTDNALIFSWVKGEVDGEQLNAYTTFITLLCKTALTKKRVTAKEKDVPENPKYAMRCWLLSLGFIGSEFKTARKILLSRLEGNGSWRDGKKADAPETCDQNENTVANDLAEVLADAELIHEVNVSYLFL